MPAFLQHDAVTVLNQNQTTRMGVTARAAELTDALRDQYLYDAPVLVLDSVDADRVASYLASTRPVGLSAEWEQLVGRLRVDPDGPLARALDNPLAITLVRDGLRTPGDVAAFLALGAAPHVEQRTLEDHLLDQLVETVYRVRPGQPPPPYDVATARRALRWVAVRTSGDDPSDVAWWHIPTWASRMPPALIVGAVTGSVMFVVDAGVGVGSRTVPVGLALLGGLGAALAAWCAAGTEVAPPARWPAVLARPGLVLAYGVAIGVLALGAVQAYLGVAAGILMTTLSLVAGGALTARDLRRRRGPPARPPEPVGVFGLGLGLGAVGTMILAGAVGGGPLAAVYPAVTLFSVGLALRLGLSRAAAPDRDTALAPLESWRRWRWTALVGWFTLAFPCALLVVTAIGLPAGPGYIGFLGVGIPALCGAALGLAFPESWVTSFACGQLAVRHRLPLHLVRFLEDARERGVLRAVGPAYRFRHRELRDRLAGPGPARRPRFARAVEDDALAWVEDRACSEKTADRIGRVAWWHIPTWVAWLPRALVVGIAGGVAVWAGFGLLSPAMSRTVAGPLVGLAAALGAAAGAARLDLALELLDGTPRSRLSTIRHPVLVGATVGLAFALDLFFVVPYEVGVVVAGGMIVGVALWLLLGVVISVGRGAVARQRWRSITDVRPVFLSVVLAASAGYVGVYLAVSTLPPYIVDVLAAVHLVLGLAVLAAGVWIGARASVGSRPDDRPVDPFASWRHRRGAQLMVWLGAGAAGGFVVRTGIRAASLLTPGPGSAPGMVLLTVAVTVAAAWGIMLGLLFPPTWMTSLACLQLALRNPVPVRLMRLLEDARDEGRVRTDGPLITVSRAPGT